MKSILKILFSIIKVILWVALLTLLAIVLAQRLSDNTISVAGFRIFNVVTPSMVPDYNVGDSILVKQIPMEQLKVGDDITYKGEKDSFKDKIVTHRIININKDEAGNYIIQTKGIANEKADPEINQTQVYGQVIYKIKSISKLNSIMGNLYGMYFIIVVPMALIIFWDFVVDRKDKNEKRTSSRRKNNKDEDDEEDEDDNKETIDKITKNDDDTEDESLIQKSIDNRIKKRRQRRRHKSE